MKNNFQVFKQISVYLILLMLPVLTMAQTSNVKGLILDTGGDPIIGASIRVKGASVGTVSDIDGNFSLEAPSKGYIVVSYIGYKSQEISLGKSFYKVVLEDDNSTLDEVVVIGYGAVKKRDLTGAITQVSAEKLMATAPTTIQDALRGKAAGVMVASNSGVNDLPMIRIRGNRSIKASNDPLFVIDGIPSTGGMESINPNDVLSMEILKDASATAIYGARGANGVIIVTTKKGETGKVNVEYSGYVSIGKVAKWNKPMNAAQYVDYIRESNRTYFYDGEGGYSINPDSNYPSIEPTWELDRVMSEMTRDQSGYVLESLRRGWDGGGYDPSKVRGFDWVSLGKNDPTVSHNHSLSIRGGSENTKVYVSGNFMNNEGFSYGSNRKRYTLRLNLDQKLGNRVTMGATTNFAYWEYEGGKDVASVWNPLANPYYSPNGDVTKDGDPAFGIIPQPAGETLLYNTLLDFDNVTKKYKRNRIESTLYAIVNLYDGLTYRANFGTDLYIAQDQEFESSKSAARYGDEPRAYQNRPIDRGWTFENIINYTKSIGMHSINLTAVQSSQKSQSEGLSATGLNMPIEDQLYYNLGSATKQSGSSSFSQWTMMSWMGRIIYGFKDSRYMLTASLRYDGSSRLSNEHKWVAFPSASLAWRINDEAFLKESAFVSNLKLRLGYGKTGNSAIDPYSTIGQIGSSRYNFGENGMMGYAPSTLSNPYLTWETTGQYNLGLDFGFLKGRISGAIEFYKQDTKDLLMNRSLPKVSGFGNILQNIGKTQNKGLEVSLETVNITNKNFQWSTNIQFAMNKEEIVNLATGATSDIANNWFVGHPVDSYYDYVKTDYIWGYSKEDMAEIAKFNANGHNFQPGDYRVQDLDGDYKITADKDRAIVGQRMPKWTLGMSNSVQYRNFDLYIFMTGMFGHTIYLGNGYGANGRYTPRNVSYWTPENTKTEYRKPLNNYSAGSYDAAYKYNKADFVRISDITLGYTLPDKLIHQIGLQRARFYTQLQNPFTITSYFGQNPEGFVSATRKYNNEYNEANNNIAMKYYMFGVNLTF